MLAVSLAEAWGDYDGGAAPMLSAAAPVVPASPRPASPPAASARRRSSKRSAVTVADASVTDLEACLLSLDQVSTELRELKAIFARQQSEQKTVFYVAIGVVIVLLLFTAHSYSRLQYASDCMLHFRK